MDKWVKITGYVKHGQFIHEHSILKCCIFRLKKSLQHEIIIQNCKDFVYCIFFKVKITYWRSLFPGLSSLFWDLTEIQLKVLILSCGLQKDPLGRSLTLLCRHLTSFTRTLKSSNTIKMAEDTYISQIREVKRNGERLPKWNFNWKSQEVFRL